MAAGAPGGQLLPNLWTLDADGFRIVNSNQGKLLRLTTTTANVGLGPMEVRPRQQDCNRDGNFANDRTAIQRIRNDVDGDGVYSSDVDTTASTHLAGCFRFHKRHGHWHFKNFARYELARMSDGVVVAGHTKVGFCLVDSQQPFPGIPGSPRFQAYFVCDGSADQGLSPGWADVYSEGLPGQFIDVTGIPDGTYCVLSTVDPVNKLIESDETDNRSGQRIALTGDSVSPIVGAC